jgi:hypothetical protein
MWHFTAGLRKSPPGFRLRGALEVKHLGDLKRWCKMY